jgi:hypothetical protein
MRLRWHRDETGQLELGAGILILLGILAIPLAIAGAKDIDDWRRGRWERQERVNPPPPLVIPTFTSPPMPSGPPDRVACYSARQGGLRWDTSRGWLHDAYPPPQLTGRRQTDEAAIAEYTRTMQGLLAEANFVAECDTPEAPPGSPPEQPAEPNVSGTYAITLTYQGGPPTACNTAGYTAQYRVSQPVRGSVRIDIGGNRVFQGPLSSSLSFEATFDGLGPRDTIRGQFRGTNEQRTLESGTVVFGAPDGSGDDCAYTFEGTRTGQ